VDDGVAAALESIFFERERIICCFLQPGFLFLTESKGLALGKGRALPLVSQGHQRGSMKTGRMTVLYRENCGGILRNLASGLRQKVRTLADLDLYDDLRERIFKPETPVVGKAEENDAA